MGVRSSIQSESGMRKVRAATDTIFVTRDLQKRLKASSGPVVPTSHKNTDKKRRSSLGSTLGRFLSARKQVKHHDIAQLTSQHLIMFDIVTKSHTCTRTHARTHTKIHPCRRAGGWAGGRAGGRAGTNYSHGKVVSWSLEATTIGKQNFFEITED